MATQQLQLVCDSSTLANFKAWAKPISDWFRTEGYTNTADTGQVNWSTIVSVPGTGAYVYDIFQSGSGGTTFYLKVEYGNASGSANSPNIRITMGTSTSGGGAITGFSTVAMIASPTSFTAPSTSTQYECDFTGDTANDRIGVMMWRNAPANQGQELIAVERSVNSSGVYTNTYVTIWAVGYNNLRASGNQQSVSFGVGAAPPMLSGSQAGAVAPFGWGSVVVPYDSRSATNTSAFNGTIPVDTCSPQVGFWDYECTMVGAALGIDIAEGVTFTVTLYGSTRTYMPGKLGPFSCPQQSPSSSAGTFAVTCMRYD